MAFLPVTEPRAGHAAFDIEKRGVVEIGKEKKGDGICVEDRGRCRSFFSSISISWTLISCAPFFKLPPSKLLSKKKRKSYNYLADC